MFDKTIEIIQEALKEAIDTKAGMKYLTEKVQDVVGELKDHDARIRTLEATRELHLEQVKSAFWEAQSRLQISPKTPEE
jgi:hypothetical protein